jgi:GR25 family glycosyltransferase involved in LPS biosynthesis
VSTDLSAVTPDCFEQTANYFQSLPRLPGCAFCDKERSHAVPRLADAVYCISLHEEDDRARQAAAHFHAIGLCHQLTFYRPRRGRDIEAAIWASHREVARHALAHGRESAVVLEDDVQFNQAWDRLTHRAARAMEKLPPGWWGFYLGHWPRQAYFVSRDVMRVRSTCAHAYIANRPLLEWLARSTPLDATIPMAWPGPAIDCAFANLPEMYALFPMVAIQRRAGLRIDPAFTPAGERRQWTDFSRHRYWLIHGAMRPAEAAAALLSPLHWMSMRMRGIGAGQSRSIETSVTRQAKSIRDAALFDDAYYLAHAADVAANGIDPLCHYIRWGDRERRLPHPLFDTAYYRRAVAAPLRAGVNSVVHYLQSEARARKDPHPLFDGERYVRLYRAARESSLAPLSHYLKIGGSEGYSPHPCFDSTWYLAEYPDVAATGENPLVHYLKCGWKEGRFPHPRFDTRRYLAEYPDVGATGFNPLDHYVRQGRAQGRAPWFA